MTPRPLSKRRLEELVILNNGGAVITHQTPFVDGRAVADTQIGLTSTDVSDIFADSAFWRDAVKNCSEWHDESDGMYPPYCDFCNGSMMDGVINHKPDCPWAIANGE